ncbi:MFS transporter [Emcibacter sp. SYSU 3D8]|uniref:MFS transporter n=1 Tax=Emcibacter sp. SYSU 3D8 TaxID=3133969 RepID=UPI0031FEB0E9
MRLYYGWNVMAVAFMCQALVYGLAMYSFTFWVTHWMAEFGASRADLMWSTSFSIAAMGAMAPFAGRAMARVPIRILVCGGIASFVLAYVMLSQASAAWQVGAIYATLVGVALLLTGPLVAQALGAAWFRRNRGFAIGIGISGLAMGGFLMPPLTTWLIGELGWRHAHLALAALVAAVALPAAWLVVRSRPEDMGLEPEPAGDEAAMARTIMDGRAWTLREILGNRAFWILAIAFFTPNFAFRGIQQNWGPYAADIGLDAQTAAFIVSISAAGQMASKLAFGALSDRFGLRTLYWIAMACLAASALLLIGRPSMPAIWAFAALMGVAAGEFTLLGVFCARQFGARDFGKVMGMLLFLITLGSFGAVLAGWVRDVTGSYDGAYYMLLALLVPSIIAMAFLHPPRPAPRAAEAVPGA